MPARRDKLMWKIFIYAVLSQDTKILNTTLGAYIREPHVKHNWQFDSHTGHLLHANKDGGLSHSVCVPAAGGRSMRSGHVYERSETRHNPTKDMYYASSVSHGTDRYKIQSTTAPSIEETRQVAFLDMLRSFPNQQMWKGMVLDGD